MTTPNETNDVAIEAETGPTNMYGGDNDWGDTPVENADRGDLVVKAEAEPEVETEEETEVEVEAESEEESEVEAEEETEVEPDTTEEESDTTDKVADEKGNMVPRNRLNKEIEKRKAMEERLRKLEATKPAEEKAPAPEVEAFSPDDFTKMQDAMLDGETEDAFAMFKKMVTASTQQAVDSVRESAKEDARAEITADKENASLQQAAVELGAKYPELDSNSDISDEGLIEDVIATRDIYYDRGHSLADALEKAVKMVAQDNSLVDRSAKKAMDDPARLTKKPSQVKKKIELAKKEKGRLEGDGGQDVKTKPNLLTMSDEEFSNASSQARREARGDFLQEIMNGI